MLGAIGLNWWGLGMTFAIYTIIFLIIGIYFNLKGT